MTATLFNFNRRPLLEGDSAGKLPGAGMTKWGWWFLPLSAISLVVATYWGTQHIEQQVEAAAPRILQKKGIAPTTMQFDASYRNINVTGTLPHNVSASEIALMLEENTGSDGETIRQANVTAAKAPPVKTKPAKTPTTSTAPTVTAPRIKAKADIPAPESNTERMIVPVPVVTDSTPDSVGSDSGGNALAITSESAPTTVGGPVVAAEIAISADVSGDSLTLKGTVPTLSHSATLSDAAKQSFSIDKIVNQLTVSELPASDKFSDDQINNMATILSNLNTDIVNAQINLDNELMSGYIYTSNADAQKKLRSVIANAPVTVLAVSKETHNQAALLQSEIALLLEDIRENVVFNTGSEKLRPRAFPTLDDIASAMQRFPEPYLEVSGHTDSQSSAGFNLTLSEQRAISVTRYLEERGISSDRLHPIGYGESQPIHTNDTADGRAKNRRVEFWAYTKP